MMWCSIILDFLYRFVLFLFQKSVQLKISSLLALLTHYFFYLIFQILVSMSRYKGQILDFYVAYKVPMHFVHKIRAVKQICYSPCCKNINGHIFGHKNLLDCENLKGLLLLLLLLLYFCLYTGECLGDYLVFKKQVFIADYTNILLLSIFFNYRFDASWLWWCCDDHSLCVLFFFFCLFVLASGMNVFMFLKVVGNGIVLLLFDYCVGINGVSQQLHSFVCSFLSL
eukprot:TRINITY_DN3635_c0_g1_i4.p2 TRINITY_DN3635_c0_g1~~TRINITY_DN3635_c0_g1_i4.p2  ORF type:complete len:226 (+),score=-5.40 TRINITY_DN3635_c0_g1_i4:295-972(+)